MMKIKNWWLKNVGGYKQCSVCKRFRFALLYGRICCSEECEDKFLSELTIDQYIAYENGKRAIVSYPYKLIRVKNKCPKCKGEMVHDEFEKSIDNKAQIFAMYKCAEKTCGHKRFYNLTRRRFEREKK